MVLRRVIRQYPKNIAEQEKNGEFTGSFAPYGYLKDPEDKNHLIIDDKTAPVVRNIFEWYVQGWGYRKITLRLNELGIPSPSEYKRQIHSAYKNINERTSHSQGLWTTPTIFKLLRNETYTGTLVQGKTRHVSYKNHSRKPVDQDEWIRTPNSHEAILDIDLWNQAQERLKSRSRSSKITLEPSLLSGKVKCAVCGAPMKRNVYYNTDRSIKYYNLKCGTYKIGVMNCENQSAISGLQLENAILEQLNELIYNYCDADKIQIKTQYEEDMRVIRQAISETKQRIEATEHKSLQLYEDKLDGTISVEQYHLFSQKFTESLESDKTKIECLEAQCNDIQSKLENDQHSADIISKYTHITKLTRPIVNEFINTIFVGTKKVGQPREITIKWNL